MDLEASASGAAPSEIQRQPRATVGARSWAFRYARIVRRKNRPDVRSRRSVIHATDSTRSGCTAKKSAATVAPRLAMSGEAAGIASPSRRRETR